MGVQRVYIPSPQSNLRREEVVCMTIARRPLQHRVFTVLFLNVLVLRSHQNKIKLRRSSRRIYRTLYPPEHDKSRFTDLVPPLRQYLQGTVPKISAPDPSTYSHEDYRYGNPLVEPTTGRTQAVLDWGFFHQLLPHTTSRTQNHCCSRRMSTRRRRLTSCAKRFGVVTPKDGRSGHSTTPPPNEWRCTG